MSFVKYHLPLISFSVFVFLSGFILFVFQNKAIKELKARNTEILSHYEKVLLLEKSPKKESASLKMDSIVDEFHLSPSQSMALQVFIRDLIDESVSQSHVDLEAESIVAAKATAMYKETHDLLEMQFAKIQHETESLQIWCGILTIVFLIFSFYSLFKTDELLQRSKEYSLEIAALRESGKHAVEDLRIRSKGSIERFKSDAKNVLSEVATKIDGQKEELEGYLRGALKDSEGELIDLSMKNLEGLDTKYHDLSVALESEWNHYMEELKKSGNQDENFSLIQELFSRIEALESK